MTRTELIDKMAEAMSIMEGFTVKGSLAQTNANPGNIRAWRDAKGPYPTVKGYVNFPGWVTTRHPETPMDQIPDAALAEGWRVAKVRIGQGIDGLYTNRTESLLKELAALGVVPGERKEPSFYEFFLTYAPSADGNHPKRYAEFVAQRCSAEASQVIKDLIA